VHVPLESLDAGEEFNVSKSFFLGIVIAIVDPEPARVVIIGGAHVLPVVGVVTPVMADIEGREVKILTVGIKPQIERPVSKVGGVDVVFRERESHEDVPSVSPSGFFPLEPAPPCVLFRAGVRGGLCEFPDPVVSPDSDRLVFYDRIERLLKLRTRLRDG
jgi:hypothetical protein